MPELGGMCVRKALNAASPPADAPMPTVRPILGQPGAASSASACLAPLEFWAGVGIPVPYPYVRVRGTLNCAWSEPNKLRNIFLGNAVSNCEAYASGRETVRWCQVSAARAGPPYKPERCPPTASAISSRAAPSAAPSSPATGPDLGLTAGMLGCGALWFDSERTEPEPGLHGVCDGPVACEGNFLAFFPRRSRAPSRSRSSCAGLSTHRDRHRIPDRSSTDRRRRRLRPPATRSRLDAGSSGYRNCITVRRSGSGVGFRLRRMSHMSSDGSRFFEESWASIHLCPQKPIPSTIGRSSLPASVRVIVEDALLRLRAPCRLTMPAASSSLRRCDKQRRRHLGHAAPQIVETGRSRDQLAQQHHGPAGAQHLRRHRNGTELIVSGLGHSRAHGVVERFGTHTRAPAAAPVQNLYWALQIADWSVVALSRQGCSTTALRCRTTDDRREMMSV